MKENENQVSAFSSLWPVLHSLAVHEKPLLTAYCICVCVCVAIHFLLVFLVWQPKRENTPIS